MKTKIYGLGWVGEAMLTLFPESIIVDPALGHPDNNEFADVSFVCVPTPNREDGSLDISIVEEVVKKCDSPLIIIRSTIMPGTCDRFKMAYNKNIVFQPEYLGETANHPMTDQKSRPFIIIGGEALNRQAAILLYQTIYNANTKIREVTAYEAEVIKLTENRAIAFKVAQCQELYDVCEAAGINYHTIRMAVYDDDPRFNLWWTFVHPNKRGFNSKCIPKDVRGWAAWAESVGFKPELTRALLETNDKLIGHNS